MALTEYDYRDDRCCSVCGNSCVKDVETDAAGTGQTPWCSKNKKPVCMDDTCPDWKLE